MRGLLLSLVCLVSTVPVVASAQAELVVVVHVAGNAEGVTVVITDQSGARNQCETDATGSCEVRGVRPGSVFVEAHAGSSAAGAHVLIPDEGKVSLVVPAPVSSPPAAAPSPGPVPPGAGGPPAE